MNTTTKTGRRMKMIAMAAALCGAATLGACSSEPEAPAAVEGEVPGIAIDNARMVLNAVEGNPAAVYFDLTYSGDRGLTIRKAEVAGAGSTTLHDFGEYDFKVQMMEALPIAISNGSEVSFEPGGLHIMVFEPSPDLQAGGTAEVTLTVSGGGTHEFTADIVPAGDPRALPAEDNAGDDS